MSVLKYNLTILAIFIAKKKEKCMFQRIRGLFVTRLTDRRNVMALVAVLLLGLLAIDPIRVAVAEPTQHIFGYCSASATVDGDKINAQIDDAFFTDVQPVGNPLVSWIILIDGQPYGLDWYGGIMSVSMSSLTPSVLSVDLTTDPLETGYHHVEIYVLGTSDNPSSETAFVIYDNYLYVP
jgi:hypothetical protein